MDRARDPSAGEAPTGRRSHVTCYTQHFDPVGNSLFASTIFAALPLIALFVLLGGLQMEGPVGRAGSLLVAILVAVIVYSMPVGQAVDAGLEGAAFGLFPIMWIVFNAIWLYNMTDRTGHFAVLRRSFERVSDDERIQAIIIAFSFGALLEALAGFGTPVAITASMLVGLGFKPMKAATVALVSNTAPVAFGAIAIPIITLAGITDLPKDDLGAMVGRQTPFLALVVPLILVGMVDGMRGVRQCWPAAMVGGFAFAIGQYACSNFLSVELTDIVAALLSVGALVAFLRVWQPSEPLRAEPRFARPAMAGGAGGRRRPSRQRPAPRAAARARDSRKDVLTAYAPYVIVIVIFGDRPDRSGQDGLADTTRRSSGPASTSSTPRARRHSAVTYTVNYLPAAGSLLLIAGLISMLVLRVSPRPGDPDLRRNAQPAEVGDAHRHGGPRPRVRDEPVGPDDDDRPVDRRRRQRAAVPVADHRLARRRGDRFGHLVELAVRRPAGHRGQGRGLRSDALAAANSSGGVLGKMISPQNLAIGAAAVGLARSGR